MNSSGQIAAVLGLVAVLFLGAALFLAFESDLPAPEEMAAQLRALGAWGLGAVVALMILHSFVPFPAEVLAACAGAVYGTLLGSALIWCGAMLGALIAFWLARKLGRTAIYRRLSVKQTKALDNWVDDQGTVTLLVSRFIPVIAFNLINYAAGLTRVSTWTFIWTTGLGILPVTILSAYLGSQMMELDWSTLLIGSTLAILLITGVHVFAKRKRLY